MKNLKSLKDFQNQQVDKNQLQSLAVGGASSGGASEIDYLTYLGDGEFANDTTKDA